MKLRSYMGGLALFSNCIEMMRSSVVHCDSGRKADINFCFSQSMVAMHFP
jgi:hypothetical protein